MIPPSPPLSALQRLSVAEPPPSASSSSGSRTPIAIPRALPVEFDPQIPRSTEPQDTTPKGSLLFQNSSSHTPDPARSTTSSDRASTARPRSKLSSLASSRASSSSGSYVSDTTKSLSVATYPHLRPGPESVLSDASIARSPSASLSPLQQSFESMSSATSETGISSMSSHVRRAIEMALQLEAVAPENSEVATQKNGTGSKKSESGTSSMSSHVRRAIETALQQEAVEQEVSVPTNQSPLLTAEVKATPPLETQVPFTATPPTPRSATSQSKLRQTALSSLSAKSSASSKGSVRPKEATASAVPSVESEPPTTNPTSGGRQPSKLALLAQSKAQQGKRQQAHWVPKMKKAPQPIPGLTLHNTHTEYLTPIANGPTATTAITTSYQSLSDLGRSSRLSPSYMPTSPVSQTHHQADKQTSPSITKQSKLAMKSRKAHQKVEAESEPELLEPEPDLEMFAPNTIRSRASPSAFASLLVNNPLLSPLEGKDPERGEPNEQERAKGRRDSAGKPKRRKSHRSEASLPPLPMSPLESFAFDIPSPDDVVFQARRGTSLAQRSNSTSSHHPPLSPTSSKTSTIRNSPLKASG